jgi:ankyrin repeat protein
MLSFLFGHAALVALDSHHETPLHAAAMNGRLDAAKLLLKRPDLDPNAQNAEGATALHLAVLNGQEAVVRLLTAHPKVSLGLRDRDGKTAHDLAKAHSHDVLAALFMQEKNDSLEETLQLEEDIARLHGTIHVIQYFLIFREAQSLATADAAEAAGDACRVPPPGRGRGAASPGRARGGGAAAGEVPGTGRRTMATRGKRDEAYDWYAAMIEMICF